MNRHYIGWAGGMVLLLTGFVLVQGGEPAASPQAQDKPGKTAQPPDPQNQKKAAPKEEEERSPRANSKAPLRVGDEEGAGAPAQPAARMADLSQEARKATNPAVRRLFEDLSPPHDLLIQPSTHTIKVETAPLFIRAGGKIPPGTKVKSLEGKKSQEMTLTPVNTRELQGFEQVVMARVGDFLKLDLDKKPAEDKEHLSRPGMLQEAEKALVAGILYFRSKKEQGLRQDRMWDDVGKELDRRLVDVQLQRLDIFINAKDWNKAFELATQLADAYSNEQSGQTEKRSVQVAILKLLAKQTDNAVKEKKFTEARQRLLQFQEQFPSSPELETVRKELRRQANEALSQAIELMKSDPTAARNKLITVQEICGIL